MKNIEITLIKRLVNDLDFYIKEKLAQEFREASVDKERNSEIELWDIMSGDGFDETND